MTYSSITFVPAVGDVGAPIALSAVGTPSSVSSPPIRYWYLQSAPPGSALRTLDQLAARDSYVALSNAASSGGDPVTAAQMLALAETKLPLATKRADLRLKLTSSGATYTPDVAGWYVVALYDITEYRLIPHFGGQVPDAGFLSLIDNELAALDPHYNSGTITPQAPLLLSTSSQGYVARSRTRTVGIAPNTATLTVRTYANVVDQSPGQAKVTLVGATTPLAKLAEGDPDVLAAMTAIRTYSGTTAPPLTFHADGSFLTVANILDAIGRWNAHLGQAAAFSTHAIVDATNTLAVISATDLPTCISSLNDLRAKYELHRVMPATVHNHADAVNVMVASACTDFASAQVLFRNLADVFFAHATTGLEATPTIHYSNATSTPVDGTAREMIETPGTLQLLCIQTNHLRALYTIHIGKAVNAAPHAAADRSNPVTSVAAPDVPTLVTLVNAWAQSLELHAQNLNADRSVPGTLFHPLGTDFGTKIAFRASDEKTARALAEICLVVMEAHMLNGVHGGGSIGGVLGASGYRSTEWPLLCRLQKAWKAATTLIGTSNVPNQNPLDSQLASEGWTLLALITERVRAVVTDHGPHRARATVLVRGCTNCRDARIATVLQARSVEAWRMDARVRSASAPRLAPRSAHAHRTHARVKPAAVRPARLRPLVAARTRARDLLTRDARRRSPAAPRGFSALASRLASTPAVPRRAGDPTLPAWRTVLAGRSPRASGASDTARSSRHVDAETRDAGERGVTGPVGVAGASERPGCHGAPASAAGEPGVRVSRGRRWGRIRRAADEQRDTEEKSPHGGSVRRGSHVVPSELRECRCLVRDLERALVPRQAPVSLTIRLVA